MERMFYEWVMGISAIALLTSLMDSMLPSGNIQRFARVALGLAMVLAILRPLYSIILYLTGQGEP